MSEKNNGNGTRKKSQKMMSKKNHGNDIRKNN